jgi:hypothetical protein
MPAKRCVVIGCGKQAEIIDDHGHYCAAHELAKVEKERAAKANGAVVSRPAPASA